MEVIEVVYNVKTKKEEIKKRILTDEEVLQINKEQQTIENNKKIVELKQKLLNTDYVANKLSEEIATSFVTGDNSNVIALRNKYFGILADRGVWREEINRLEEELKNGN